MPPIGYEYAFVNGEPVNPTRYKLLYHGTDSPTVDEARSGGGLAAKGDDLELIHHAEPLAGASRQSAFRGTVQVPLSAILDSGAALWGRWVYQITDYPGYDINSLLQGRIPTPGGFRGPLMRGEQEIAIPAEVPLVNIALAGEVIQGSRGPKVQWLENW
jgi:hypothetical protein